MSRFAHIDQIKSGVVFSDPWYKDDVWCQYRKAFTDTNWFAKLDFHVQSGEFPSLNFELLMGRPTVANSVSFEAIPEGIAVHSPARYQIDHVELGIDRARMFCGSYEDFEKYGESVAFRTGGDGMFGDLFVFTVPGDDAPAGYALFCAFAPGLMTQDKFLGTILASLEGKEISEKEYNTGISPKNLGNRMLLANELNLFAKHQENPAPEKAPETPERE